MALPLVDLSEYTPQDDAILHQWWEDEEVQRFLGPLPRLLGEPDIGTSMPGTGRIARPTLRWMVRDSAGQQVGFVSVQITGQGESAADPIGPPFHAGVNLVVAPGRRQAGIGTAILNAVYHHPLLADMATLGSVVDTANVGSLAMTAKAGLPEGTEDGRGRRQFTIPGPAYPGSPATTPAPGTDEKTARLQ
ncbi:GNAT family N-acetyltransferase [Nocardia brasiliensis]|uniref:GNAT family N-acetyltransferase n=1 Tax=Nocardia brasiliensis TaxID=37326 RepID=UPI0033FF04FC